MGKAGLAKSRILFEFRRGLGEDILYLEGRCISLRPAHSAPARRLAPQAQLPNRLRVIGTKPFATRSRGLRTLGADAGAVSLPPEPPRRRNGRPSDPRHGRRGPAPLHLRGAPRPDHRRQRPPAHRVRGRGPPTWIDPASAGAPPVPRRETARERPCSCSSLTIRATRLHGPTAPTTRRSRSAPLSEGESGVSCDRCSGSRRLPATVKAPDLPEGEGRPLLSRGDHPLLRRHGHPRPRGRSDMSSRQPLTPQDVPDTVQGVIMARIDRLADYPEAHDPPSPLPPSGSGRGGRRDRADLQLERTAAFQGGLPSQRLGDLQHPRRSSSTTRRTSAGTPCSRTSRRSSPLSRGRRARS